MNLWSSSLGGVTVEINSHFYDRQHTDLVKMHYLSIYCYLPVCPVDQILIYVVVKCAHCAVVL